MIEVTAEGLQKRYGTRMVLDGVQFQVKPGEWFGILGPNGSGKTTLLQALSGVEPVNAGSILLGGRPVEAYTRRELARQVAVLQQDALPRIGFTVQEVIEMGRYPYQNWLGEETGDSSALVERVIQWLKLEPLRERTVDQLSGGERQRVALGKAMAQEPRLLLLDEPTTFLDIGYQVEMMDMVRRWQKECGMTVIAVLHDLNLAAQYCDRLMLLHRGAVAADGVPQDVMQAGLLEQVYGTRPHVLAHPASGVPQILLAGGSRDE
ncbi:iron complex transport system ATP-binding protein [Paenibacillus sp. UNCCL117]|uniref:heme ABC transporter ATP-binding protein n=1 Tax=unclassified Paenibacillus TaxID=185978 RepID=UPI000881DBC3|nr:MULTISPECIES: heme ABC transporter ATP-binding protein [unclassified Paenibacillus]SDC00673.1 iron complex transport system ATP-binding protein [Paenibacillus sp. cl123]SFW36416.1 iron complex transport system ATP-binding protein [Paenibacillus sp. UNCCL117]